MFTNFPRSLGFRELLPFAQTTAPTCAQEGLRVGLQAVNLFSSVFKILVRPKPLKPLEVVPAIPRWRALQKVMILYLKSRACYP
jgi:hypothetical protein